MEADCAAALSAWHDDGVDDEELFAAFAERLRRAHQRVAALAAPAAEKLSITKRLLVISDASKHGVTRASARLEAFLAELDERFPGSSA